MATLPRTVAARVHVRGSPVVAERRGIDDHVPGGRRGLRRLFQWPPGQLDARQMGLKAHHHILGAFDGSIQHKNATGLEIGQRPDRRSGGAAGPKHQGWSAGRFDLDLPHPPRQAARIGVAADKPPSLIDDGVEDAERQDLVRHLVHEGHHRLLVRRGDVGAHAIGLAQTRNGLAQRLRCNLPGFVVGVDAQAGKRRVVQRRRERVRHRLAKQTGPPVGHAPLSAWRSAQKLGYEMDTLSAPAISAPSPSAPASAKSMAMRWSPWLSA